MKQKFTKQSNNHRNPRFIFCRHFDDERIINYEWPYRTSSVKINHQIFQWIQKTMFWAYFWSIFPTFAAKFFSRENPALSRKTSFWYLALCQNLDSKKTPGQKDKLIDGQTLFYRTLPAIVGGSKKHWVHFVIKNIFDRKWIIFIFYKKIFLW